MSRNRYGNVDTTAPGEANPELLNYQGSGGGDYPPPRTIRVLRGRASVADRVKRTGNSGMPPPKGFPPLPME